MDRFAVHIIASAVIDAYGKCEVRSTRKIFDTVSRSDDVVIFNSMIMAYAHNGLVNEVALEIFVEMKGRNLWPSQATFVSILSARSHMGFLDEGCVVFQSMSSDYGMKPSPGIFSCLADMLWRKGCLENAKSLIKTMPFEPWPGIWRSFLSGCRIHGNRELGKWASEKLRELVPENDTGNVLLFKVYTEPGHWEDAARLRHATAR